MIKSLVDFKLISLNLFVMVLSKFSKHSPSCTGLEEHFFKVTCSERDNFTSACLITLTGKTFTTETFANFANFMPVRESLSRETQSWSLHAKAYPRKIFRSCYSWKFTQWKIFSNFMAKISFQPLQFKSPAMLKNFVSYKIIWASSCLQSWGLQKKERYCKIILVNLIRKCSKKQNLDIRESSSFKTIPYQHFTNVCSREIFNT